MKKYLFLLSIVSLQCFGVTLSEWKKYKKSEKINYISGNLGDIEISLDDGSIKGSRLSLPRLEIVKKNIEVIYKNLLLFETDLDTDVEDEYYGLVGDLQKSAELFFSEDNHFLGAQIKYFQLGCSHLDENDEYFEAGGHYKDISEAEKNNCFEEDVSWTGYSIIDQQFKELEYSDYMEWTGH